MARLVAAAGGVVVLAAGAFALWYRVETATPETLVHTGDNFTPRPLEVESYDLNDIGVTDVDGDGRLDVFTTNHSARQSLLLNRGDFSFAEIFPRSGLAQSRAFPEVEDASRAPAMGEPGLYVFRQHRRLVFQAVDLEQAVEGSVQAGWPLEVRGDERGIVERRSVSGGGSLLRFRLAGGERLEIVGQQDIIEFPHRVVLDTDTDTDAVFIGLARSNPPGREFVLEWRDRHAQVWGDFSDDGVPDVLITRGGARGQAARFDPPPVDELLLGDGDGGFTDAPDLGGLVKDGCPGRATQRVDVDSDGLLDLHVVCGRFRVANHPDQLWLQGPGGRYAEGAAAAGLASGEMSVGLWLDVDGDRDADYVAEQGAGLYLYRNAGGRFERVELDAGRFRQIRAYAAADIDHDGDLDVLSIGKRESVLLENRDGDLVVRRPGELGLPESGQSGSFIDVDNDGVVEYHDPLAGLFRRGPHGRFAPSGELAYLRDPERVTLASCSWFDVDGDGAVDALCGFVYRPSLLVHRLEERVLGRPSSRRSLVQLLRNEYDGGNWLQVDLRGGRGNPEAIGARVVIETDGRILSRRVGSAEGALFSQGHYRLYFGLGEASVVEALRVEWPDGGSDVHHGIAAGRRHLIERSGTLSTP